MKYISIYVSCLTSVLLMNCNSGEKSATSNADSTTTSPAMKEYNFLGFDHPRGHATASVALLTNSNQNGVYFSVRTATDTLARHLLSDEFYYTSVLNSLEHQTINGKPYLYFSLWKKQQGNGAGLSSAISLYIYNVQADSLLELRYEGMDVNDENVVAGRLQNGEDVPHNEAIAKVLFGKMYNDKHLACLSPWPFNNYITDWSYDDSRFCEEMSAEHPLTKYDTEEVYRTSDFPLSEIEGEWMELTKNQEYDQDFYFTGQDCNNKKPEEKGINITAEGLAVIDQYAGSIFRKSKSRQKTFHLLAGEISYELEYVSSDSSTYKIEIYPVGIGALMDPHLQAIRRYYSPDEEFDVYIVPKQWQSSFEIRNGSCDEP